MIKNRRIIQRIPKSAQEYEHLRIGMVSEFQSMRNLENHKESQRIKRIPIDSHSFFEEEKGE